MGFRGELNAVHKKKELTRGRAVAERLAVLNEQRGVGVYFDRLLLEIRGSVAKTRGML